MPCDCAALRERVADLQAKVAGLAKALEPFAKALAEAKSRGFHEWAAGTLVKVEDFRCAAAALSATPAEHHQRIEAEIRNKERRALLEKAGIATGAGLPIEIGLEDAEEWLQVQLDEAERRGMERAEVRAAGMLLASARQYRAEKRPYDDAQNTEREMLACELEAHAKMIRAEAAKDGKEQGCLSPA